MINEDVNRVPNSRQYLVRGSDGRLQRVESNNRTDAYEVPDTRQPHRPRNITRSEYQMPRYVTRINMEIRNNATNHTRRTTSRRTSDEDNYLRQLNETTRTSFRESLSDIIKNPVNKQVLKIKTNTFKINTETCGDFYKNCSICITDFDDQEEVRILPCFHVFHVSCIDTWFKDNNWCPLCKKKLQ